MMYESCLLNQILLKIVGFLEISRNRLAMLKTHQETHASESNFLGFPMNYLVAVFGPPGDVNWFALVFCFSCDFSNV